MVWIDIVMFIGLIICLHNDVNQKKHLKVLIKKRIMLVSLFVARSAKDYFSATFGEPETLKNEILARRKSLIFLRIQKGSGWAKC